MLWQDELPSRRVDEATTSEVIFVSHVTCMVPLRAGYDYYREHTVQLDLPSVHLPRQKPNADAEDTSSA